jgi:hypothetical protein
LKDEIGGHVERMGEMRNVYTGFCLEELGVDGRIILEWID